MVDFPEYSREARQALDLFVAEQVVAIFYFEDERHESVYERLIRRLFPNIKAFWVICLGGKADVIKKARSARSQAMINVFVVDKDYDDLLGLEQDIPDLFYLDRFCLENYFIDVGALIEVAVEEEPRLTVYQAQERMSDRNAFIRTLFERCEAIARLFVTARRFEAAIETTKMPGATLLEGAPDEFPVPTREWIASYRHRLLQALGGQLTDDEFDVMLADVFPAGAIQHLHGKHLLYCLVRYLGKRLGLDLHSMDRLTFYLRLLTHIDLRVLTAFATALRQTYPQMLRAE